MTIDTECQRLTGSFRATRDRRRFCDAGGSRLMSLTLGKAIGRQRTHAADLADLRLAFDCNADPAFSPVTAGRGRYPGGHYARYPLPFPPIGRFSKAACHHERLSCFGNRRRSLVRQPRPCAGNADHPARFDGCHRLLRHDHPRHRRRPAAGGRPGRRNLHRYRTRHRCAFSTFQLSAARRPASSSTRRTPFEVLASQIGQVFGADL